jgi:peptidoglycan/LPS O-acetylase OafA/YrhL
MNNRSFHPHIEGLRALAILLVLLFHAGLPLEGGYIGVDIFFVISGFLITGLLLREMETSGDVSLLNFYARRAKRLLPASCFVLAFTALGVWLFAPASARVVFGLDIASAAAYFANFRFAARSVDYLAEGLGRSPVLHFWSLAVEEQFYFIWPVLLLAALRLAKRTHWSQRACATGFLLVVFVPSLLWSILFTSEEPSSAFFVTQTRLWELALGALLAVGMPWLQRLGARFASFMAATGWLFIAASLYYADSDTTWPGASALLPTTGAALLIASGVLAPKARLLLPLTARPMIALGGLSYSLYLWHWPFLVIGADFLGFSGWAAGLALVTMSTVPAYLSHKFIENKFRFSTTLAARPTQALSLGLNLTLLAVLLGFLFPLQMREREGSTTRTVTLEAKPGRVIAHPSDLGASAIAKSSKRSAEKWAKLPLNKVVPEPAVASKDVPSAYARGCQMRAKHTTSPWCKSGDPNGKVDVAVVGDSKILQYDEALDATGNALGWRIRTATKSTCAFSAASINKGGKQYKECDAFNKHVLEALLKDPPDLVITSQSVGQGYMAQEKKSKRKRYTRQAMAEGLAKYWSALERRGTHVIVVLDNPHPPERTRKGKAQAVYDCVVKNPGKYDKCAFALNDGRARSAAPAQLAAQKIFPKVNVVDLTKYICPHDKCSPVIDGVLVYRQTSHLTNTYAKTLAPLLTEELERAAFKANPRLASIKGN